MPQMAPINWLSLFFIFLIIFILYNILNYFSFNLKKNNKNLINKNKSNLMNWKW